MAALLIEHTITDFDTWLPQFESHAAVRQAAGVTATIVWQDADNPNHAFVILKHPDIEVLRGFSRNPELAARMKAAGLVGTPTFTFLGEPRKYPF